MDSDRENLDKTKEIVKDSEKKSEKDGVSLEESICDLAFNLLINSQTFKQARMDVIAKYERMYYNDIPPAYRQIHNVKVPVFSGLIDTLLADLNDDIMCKLQGTKPSDDLVLPKIQAHWEDERDSLEPTAMWNKKMRWGRFNAMLGGVDIQQEYAESDPEYRNVLETINYTDFHCQPLGGGNLENHLFAGREGIFRTLEEIESNESYPKKQRDAIKNFSPSSEWWQNIESTYGTRLQRFKSNYQDVNSNSFTGERTFNLARFVVTYKGERYAVLFEPLSKTWLSVKPWKELNGGYSDYPWKAAHTHEDHKLFWSKSFADDFYCIADLVNIFYSQEATNREKRNNGARAFDPEMYQDPARLDEAQFVPGRLVPYNSNGGVRQAAQGIFEFTTPELTGTINLAQNLMQILGNYTGANELSMGAQQKSAKPSVIVAQQQQLAKRIGFRSESFKERNAQLIRTYIQGMIEHMPSKMSVSVLGENGFIEEHELLRAEIATIDPKRITIKIISSSEQENADNAKKEARMKAIDMVSKNPTLNKYEKEMIYRDVGNFDEAQIAFALDDLPYTARKQIAHASKAIQALLRNKEPEIYYGADATYMRYIQNFIVDNRTKLKKKYQAFFDYMAKIASVAEMNEKVNAAKAAATQPTVGADGKPIATKTDGTGAPAKGAVKSPIQPTAVVAQKMGQAGAK